MAASLQSFAFDADQASLQASIAQRMVIAYEEKNVTLKEDSPVPGLLAGNAGIVAEITHKALQQEKASLHSDDTPESVVERITQKVRSELVAAYNAAAPDSPLKIAVDGLKVGTSTLSEGMGQGYFDQIANGLKEELTSNFHTHKTEFKALKQAPAQASPPAAPEPASAVPATPAPRSLMGIFNVGGAAVAAFGDKDKIKETLRQSITAMGQKPEDYPEQDIDRLAGVIQEDGGEWITAHGKEIKVGNLSHDRLKQLSSELALTVRSHMNPASVGKFAEDVAFGTVSLRDVVTGMDDHGRIAHPYQMNLQGMAEAALTGAAGDAAARQRYLEQLALEESRRAFYAAHKDGITPGEAAAVAEEQARKAGYGQRTQAMVSQMAENAFQPSAFSGLGTIWDYLVGFIMALFSGALGNFFTSIKDGSFSADRHEKNAGSNNYSLYQGIIHSDPTALGYEGAPEDAEFDAWRNRLATDVTGIHPSSRSGVYVDHSLGRTHGIAAVTLGLTPDGASPVEGMENIHGVPRDQLEQKERELSRQADPAPRSSGQQYQIEQQPEVTRQLIIPCSPQGAASQYCR